ncbi:MAG: radical SAM protein [Spirochaetes bacterium]|nr:radical SAM protein [Spirochaetota bacterium]
MGKKKGQIKPSTRFVNSLMIMCTYSCQLHCDYCEIKRLSRSMSRDTLRKAIDLLLSTQSPKVLLRFWGGEPLLQWDLVKYGITFGEKRARQKEKTIRFMITTNGLLLDKEKLDYLRHHDVEIMFSFDGDRKTNEVHRFLQSGKTLYDKTLQCLMLLINSRLKYFVNIVVTPRTVNTLCANLEFLQKLKIKRVQLCYQNGILWPEARKGRVINELKKYIVKGNDSDFLMNYTNDCEPTMLSQEILVDTDGRVYSDAAIFMEKKFPRLRGSYFRGRAEKIGKIDSLYRSKRDLWHIFKDSCSSKEKKVLENNIDLGLKLDSFFNSFYRHSLDSNENSILISIMKGDLHEQKKCLHKFKIKSLYLYIDGPCWNDCLFCKHKEGRFSDLFKLELKLKDNLKIKAKKLCIIGNEPLLHPEIMELVDLTKKYGFKEVEIMTSGELLNDKRFCNDLVQKGVSSFSLPLFAHRAGIHDPIVGRKGSFSQVIQGIKNTLGAKAGIYIHTNLIRQNLEYMKELETYVREELRMPFVILPVRPKTTNIPFSRLVPSYTEIIKNLKGIRSLIGFPLCVTKQVQKELFKSSSDISDSMKLYVLSQKFYRPAVCQMCFHRNRCSGLFREYLYYFGSKEIKPFSSYDA